MSGSWFKCLCNSSKEQICGKLLEGGVTSHPPFPSSILNLDTSILLTSYEIPQVDGSVSLISESSYCSESSNCSESQIPVHITSRRNNLDAVQLGPNKRNLITIRRNNRLLDATNLPTIISLNPRSLYNKQSNFKTLVEQTEASVCLVSETWDRSHTNKGKLISDVLEIEGYKWVKNVCQRKRRGGKPAILINEKEYHITELCPDTITVPAEVEAVWALITPKCKHANTKIKHIVIGSVYYSSTQTRKSAFLDHIAEAFHLLFSKYGSDTPIILGGDFNRLNIKPILSLSPNLKQNRQM